MILQRFADYAAGLNNTDLPDAAVHAAKRAVIDWFASALRGGLEPPATLLANAFADASGSAILYPSGRTTDPRTAALINGAASHTIEFDDIYRDGLYHPGAPVISAVLALAQAKGLNGRDFLRSVIAGYEVSTRMAAAVNPAHYEFWHTTGTIGTIGAAAGAAAVLNLDGDGMAHAMANAGTMAAGLQQAFRGEAMAKPMHTAHAAQTGVMLALAAQHGVTGVLDILEGPRGFGAAMCRDPNNPAGPDWQAAADDLGKSFTIERMTFKNHAACGHIHAAIDGVLALRTEHGLKPKDIASIHVGSFQKALEICGNMNPQTIFEAKFSLPYCAAMMIREGRVRLDAFSAEWLQDRELRDLITKVEVSVDAEIDAGFPLRRAARITINTTGGETLEHYAPTRKGDPDNPLSDAELADKFLEITNPVLGEDGAAAFLDHLWRLDEADDLCALPLIPVKASAAQ
ncbi:MAG: MmgE/PrpD family protein [Proteobacteria bacterium]|nr:MmgE/PrpD family protein [Pseudomonadota bacterium]